MRLVHRIRCAECGYCLSPTLPAKQGGFHGVPPLLYIAGVSQSYIEGSLHVVEHRELHL